MYHSHYTLNDYEVLEIKGELDCVTVAERKELIENVPTVFDCNIVFDLSQVTFIDSSGIGVIVYLFKRLREQGRELILVGLSGQPKELMSLLRIDRAIPVKDSARSCLAS
ncbi:STAS domain-containing protein [Marinomonas transparens]|uniref:Anti-sigma factor antagonist n=1 Tax=Marinomonas transparens TaxID=2795388 RepID=A0A934JPH5_9GAMM|nr:STAS domain-containing protein [Marinomonas transparens]MBJ7538258.1 STAS domain-containing protein [Marinomonas transparens]